MSSCYNVLEYINPLSATLFDKVIPAGIPSTKIDTNSIKVNNVHMLVYLTLGIKDLLGHFSNITCSYKQYIFFADVHLILVACFLKQKKKKQSTPSPPPDTDWVFEIGVNST